jgi:hypothetical protein
VCAFGFFEICCGSVTSASKQDRRRMVFVYSFLLAGTCRMPEALLAHCLLFLLRARVVMGFSYAIVCGIVVIPASYGDNPIKVCALSFL